MSLQRYQEQQMKAETTSPRPESSKSNQDYDDVSRSSVRKRTIRNIDDDEWIHDTPRKIPKKSVNVPIERKPPVPKTQIMKPIVKVSTVQATKPKPPQPQIFDEPNEDENTSFELNSSGKKVTPKVQKLQVRS